MPRLLRPTTPNPPAVRANVPATADDLQRVLGAASLQFKFPTDRILSDAVAFVRAMRNALAKKSYPAHVIEEAFQRRLYADEWFPSVAAIVKEAEKILAHERQRTAHQAEEQRQRAAWERKQAEEAEELSRAKAVFATAWPDAASQFDQAAFAIKILVPAYEFAKWLRAVLGGNPWACEAVAWMATMPDPERLARHRNARVDEITNRWLGLERMEREAREHAIKTKFENWLFQHSNQRH